MSEIKCPYDLNQFILGEPIFENPFPDEECEKRKYYGDCYHCFSTAIASRDNQLKASVTPQQKWIPITYRPMTDEEKKDFAERTGYDEKDFDDILNCPLPEDNETVLITDRLGNVEVDTFINDGDGCYFECNCDMEDVKAWMPLPQPYTAEGSDKKCL